MKKPLDLPIPPLCAATPESAVHEGEPVHVQLHKGDKLSGKLIEVDHEYGRIGLILEGGGTLSRVDIHEIQTLTLPRPRPWKRDDDPLLAAPPGTPAPREKLEFEIEFNDRNHIAGETYGFRNDRYGIHLFPARENERYIHVYIPNSAIARHRVGKPIGQQLVTDHVASDQDVAMALLDQQEKRARALGEHLAMRDMVKTEQLAHALERQEKMPHLQFGEILVEENMITREQLMEALAQQQQQRKETLGDILVAKGVTKPGAVQKSLARKHGTPFIDPRKSPPEAAAMEMIPREFAERHGVLPLRRHDEKLICAMEDTTDGALIDALHDQSGLLIEPVAAMRNDIIQAIAMHYSKHVKQTPPPAPPSPPTVTNIVKPPPPPPQPTAAPVVKSTPPPPAMPALEQAITAGNVDDFLRDLIEEATRTGVSHIHIEATPHKNARVRLRRGGLLQDRPGIPASVYARVRERLRGLAWIEPAHATAASPGEGNNENKTGARSGLLDISVFGHDKLAARLTALPTADGADDFVLELEKPPAALTLEQLDFTGPQLKSLFEILQRRRGLVIACGPAGAGKRQTLRALLGVFATPQRKVWSLASDITGTLMGVRTLATRHDDAHTIMENILHADPDALVLDSLLSPTRAADAIKAALHGPLVFAAMPTAHAAEVVERLAQLGVPLYALADGLALVISQRLAPRLCPKCKKRHPLPAEELRLLAQEYAAEMATPATTGKGTMLRDKVLAGWEEIHRASMGDFAIHRPGGCDACHHTGHNGHIAIHEVLVIDEPMRRQIADGGGAALLHKTAVANGMKTLKQDAIDKVLQGHLDLSQARAACL